MDLIAYLRILRRRWTIVLVPFLAAVLLGWLSLPEQQTVTTNATTYTSTATLIAGGSSPTQVGSPTVPLPTIALFTTVGDVPRRAAEKLRFEGEPQLLAAQVTVTPVGDTGTLTITSTDRDPQLVAKRVNAFARATIDFFREKQDSDITSRIEAIERQLDSTTRQLRAVQDQLEAAPDDPVLEARSTALKTQYSAQFSEIETLSRELGGAGPVDMLQEGVPIPLSSAGFVAPTNPFVRIGVAALLGIVLGAALALVIERIDSRLRSRGQVEEAYNLPVIAEIPTDSFSQRGTRDIASSSRPASGVAEAYRALRSAIFTVHPRTRNESGGLEGFVVLVTSALSDEGKTTTVANLAAVMAEAGRSVVVLSMDLRQPRLHEHFGLQIGTGISDLLAADRGAHLDQVLRETPIPGVRIATSGQRLDHPGALLASTKDLIDAARSLADVVLVDAPPLLHVSDPMDVAPHVDGVLVVSRFNRSTALQAISAQRLLSRLKTPLLGTVIVGGSTAPDGYRFPGLPLRSSRPYYRDNQLSSTDVSGNHRREKAAP